MVPVRACRRERWEGGMSVGMVMWIYAAGWAVTAACLIQDEVRSSAGLAVVDWGEVAWCLWAGVFWPLIASAAGVAWCINRWEKGQKVRDRRHGR